MSDYYNIIERRTFYLVVQECEDIEQLTDSFITTEEFEANYFEHGIDGPTLYFKDKIQAALIEWSDTIKPGSACTSIKPAIIKELYFELNNHGYFIDKFSPTGFSVQGHRIYDNEAERERSNQLGITKLKKQQAVNAFKAAAPYVRQERPLYKDRCHLFQAFRNITAIKHDIEITFRGDNHKSITFIKRNCNWAEMLKQLKHLIPKKQYPQDIIWIKKLWANPELNTPQY